MEKSMGLGVRHRKPAAVNTVWRRLRQYSQRLADRRKWNVYGFIYRFAQSVLNPHRSAQSCVVYHAWRRVYAHENGRRASCPDGGVAFAVMDRGCRSIRRRDIGYNFRIKIPVCIGVEESLLLG